ncbi:hypothetical protein [Streptomyces sp. NBC_01373]|uniref:hypothetical protein n=1 Tax=Streptomyces sp. NBC_01373 TaxID=2903843 RepID=UPI002254E1E3|nr:hypothetical protein [Streptomyces sp. NBC_01373]MCX4700117.1 hypothetical protein [Streptomyces sp. NBC_01373]
MEARALPNAGEGITAARAMKEAERRFGRADTAEDPAWLGYFDEAELMGELCHCFRDLRMRREAVEQAQRAVDSTDRSTPAHRASAAWCSPKANYPTASWKPPSSPRASQSTGGDSLQSTRFQRYVTDFQTEVSVHAANLTVAAFNEKVHDALNRLDEDDE